MRGLAAASVTIVLVGAQASHACDLQMMPSQIFGPSCQVLVGSYNGVVVGPFHVSLPDGSVATAGTCEGYVPVQSVNGNVVSLGQFHSVAPRVYTLADDCRRTVKMQ